MARTPCIRGDLSTARSNADHLRPSFSVRGPTRHRLNERRRTTSHGCRPWPWSISSRKNCRSITAETSESEEADGRLSRAMPAETARAASRSSFAASAIPQNRKWEGQMSKQQEPPIDPMKVATIDQYLKQAFGGDTVQTSYDPTRAAQFYRVGRGAAITHRIFVSKAFLDNHTHEDITPLL